LHEPDLAIVMNPANLLRRHGSRQWPSNRLCGR